MNDANGREIRVGDTVEHARPAGSECTQFGGRSIVLEIQSSTVVVRRTSGAQIPVYMPEHLVVIA